MKHWRSSIIALAAALALSGGARLAQADENKPAAAQPADKAAAAMPMEGCKADGSCCGTGACQKQAAAADAGGGCPCQRAKRAAEAAAAAQQQKE